jgi:hypothetical protein
MMAALTCSQSDGAVMSTAETETRASLSAEAHEAIQCFYDGLDVIVRELAEEIAEARGSYLEDKKTIAIETQDVKEAGNQVIEALKGLIKQGKLPEQLSAAVENMQGCFNNHVS